MLLTVVLTALTALYSDMRVSLQSRIRQLTLYYISCLNANAEAERNEEEKFTRL